VTIADLLLLATQVAGLLFVVTSMLAMGLGLTGAQIITPLKNLRLVALALVANFVLVPALAYGLTKVIPLEQSLAIGLIILGTAAGAPFLPKLVLGARADIGFGVGLMVLLMVTTVVYMPIVLPLMISGATVDAWAIAKSLIVLLLVPLGIGLLLRSHSPDSAAGWQPLMAKTSSLALLVLLVLAIGLNVSNIIDLIGTGGILALLLFIAASLAIGLILAWGDEAARSVMALGAAQRNVSAALVVVAQNFAGTATLPFVLVGALLMLIILLPTAKRLGARAAMTAA
jgi:BASS family bile acid:Na+ symporter